MADINHIDEYIAKSVLEHYVYPDLTGYVVDRPDIQFNYNNRLPSRRAKCDVGIECVRVGDERYCHFENDATKLQLGVKSFTDKDIVKNYRPRKIGNLRLLHFKDKSTFSTLMATLIRNFNNKKNKCTKKTKHYKGYRQKAKEVGLFITLYFDLKENQIEKVVDYLMENNNKVFDKIYLFLYSNDKFFALDGNVAYDYQMNATEKCEIINKTIKSFPITKRKIKKKGVRLPVINNDDKKVLASEENGEI